MKLIKEPIQVNWRKILAHLAIITVLFSGIFAGYKGFQKVHAVWPEIKFAYEHADFIRSIREDYQGKVKNVEESYKQKDPSPEQRLIEEAVKQLQEGKDSR